MTFGHAAPGEIDIALGFDAKYAPHAGVVMASIVRHAPGAKFRFILLNDGVESALRAKVEACAPGARFVWAEIADGDLPAYTNWGHFNRAILFRIGLEKYAPGDCTRVLYIDSDTIVCGDVREVWDAKLGANAIGAMLDCYQNAVEFAERWSLPPDNARYFNSGVMLIDLARVRAERMFSAASDFLARNGKDIVFGDQDALNWVFWRRWTELDPAWNVQRYVRGQELVDAKWRRATPGIVHFIGPAKPWTRNVWHWWAWLYWENIVRTPFADEVAAVNKMDLYQRLRLRLRWWLRRPGGVLAL